ncbi:predicted protein [Pyrenophora tritici-repentis Pt-1C-BFP]|uniref:Uncharacterized protein n=1 Tax=Pyrenophora tritici-repentis (strain Pt-1C-BFP) TaxID=426418 RepID=B2VXL8_PYRTR|nr:uncharacterized protein PTRG_03264 [Pyrenophora tritici-repentis Pt-1C-BFP]EDU45787.1 predicted protein [Pyrenophora tritici-repentis Pt-1C-BFP]
MQHVFGQLRPDTDILAPATAVKDTEMVCALDSSLSYEEPLVYGGAARKPWASMSGDPTTGASGLRIQKVSAMERL